MTDESFAAIVEGVRVVHRFLCYLVQIYCLPTNNTVDEV